MESKKKPSRICLRVLERVGLTFTAAPRSLLGSFRRKIPKFWDQPPDADGAASAIPGRQQTPPLQPHFRPSALSTEQQTPSTPTRPKANISAVGGTTSQTTRTSCQSHLCMRAGQSRRQHVTDRPHVLNTGRALLFGTGHVISRIARMIMSLLYYMAPYQTTPFSPHSPTTDVPCLPV
jgi:hypothetical protein